MSSGIYVIRNLVNDKLYVGKSVHIENRWLEHQSDLRNGRHANIHLQRAYDKYGPDNLLHEVLELCEEDVPRWESGFLPGRGLLQSGGADSGCVPCG